MGSIPQPAGGKYQSGKMTLNIKAMDWLDKVVGHEVTHMLERGGGYDKLDSLMVQYAKEKGEYDSRMESIWARYEGVYRGKDFDAMCQKELTAELVD